MRAKLNNPYEVLRESQDIWEAIDNVTVVITTFEHKKLTNMSKEKPHALPLEFFTFLSGKD